MLDDIITTDEDELARLGAFMSGALAVDIAKDSQVVVRGHEICERAFQRLEEETKTLIGDEANLDRILSQMKYSVVKPLLRIREAATAIQEGRTYNPLGLGASFGAFIVGYIELRSRALEYRA